MYIVRYFIILATRVMTHKIRSLVETRSGRLMFSVNFSSVPRFIAENVMMAAPRQWVIIIEGNVTLEIII